MNTAHRAYLEHKGWNTDLEAMGEGHYGHGLRRDGTLVTVFKDRCGCFHDTLTGEKITDLRGWKEGYTPPRAPQSRGVGLNRDGSKLFNNGVQTDCCMGESRQGGAGEGGAGC